MTKINEIGKNTTKSEMTGRAYDLLDCFVSGLDKVVYEIAESIAREAGQLTEAGVVEIRYEDVRSAADLVFKAIKENASIPKDALADIEQMHACVQEKCELTAAEK